MFRRMELSIAMEITLSIAMTVTIAMALPNPVKESTLTISI